MAPGELVFTVDGSKATPSTPITLAEAGLRERQDLQEWVIAHPEILGTDVLIVTFEFDRWWASSGSRERDRLDVLGIDTDGRLVVVELKRDKAPDTVEMQAIKYASMASRFTEDTLVDQFADFRARGGEPRDEESARAGPTGSCRRARPGPTSSTSHSPRRRLISAGRHRIGGLDVRDGNRHHAAARPGLQSVRHEDDHHRLAALSSSRRGGIHRRSWCVRVAGPIIPGGPKEALRGQSGCQTAQVGGDRGRHSTHVPDRPTESGASGADDRVARRRSAPGQGIWQNDRQRPLIWEANGDGYRPAPLVHEMFRECGFPIRTTRTEMVATSGRPQSSPSGGHYCAPTVRLESLHQVLANLPIGHWTTYADLAEPIGTSPQVLGVHVNSCPDCENAWRVLGMDGRPRRRFRWADPDDERSQEDALTAEGVRFVDGVADSGQRLSDEELADLLADDSEGL